MYDRDYIKQEREKLEKLWNSPQIFTEGKLDYYFQKKQELNELEEKLIKEKADGFESICWLILGMIYIFSGFNFAIFLSVVIFLVIGLCILSSIISALEIIFSPSKPIGGRFRVQTRCFRG